MNRSLALASLIAASFSLAVSPLRAAAGDSKLKVGWDGFGVGSSVQTKTTSKTSGPGMPATPAQVIEQRMTLLKVTDDTYTVKSESKAEGMDWQGTEIALPRKGQVEKGEDLGEEKVSVEGTDLSCKKTRNVVGGVTKLSWTNEKYGLVKSEETGPGTSTTSVLTRLAGKTKVGSTDVEYRELTTTMKQGGANTTVTMWISDRVPGGTVRSEMTSELGGGIKSVSVTEAVSFERK